MTTRSRDEVQRQSIQDALERFEAGTCTSQDIDLMCNRDIMYHATADQACQFKRAALKSRYSLSTEVSHDLLWTWFTVSTIRWEQSRKSMDRKRELATQRANGTPTFRTPTFLRKS